MHVVMGDANQAGAAGHHAAAPHPHHGHPHPHPHPHAVVGHDNDEVFVDRHPHDVVDVDVDDDDDDDEQLDPLDCEDEDEEEDEDLDESEGDGEEAGAGGDGGYDVAMEGNDGAAPSAPAAASAAAAGHHHQMDDGRNPAAEAHAHQQAAAAAGGGGAAGAAAAGDPHRQEAQQQPQPQPQPQPGAGPTAAEQAAMAEEHDIDGYDRTDLIGQGAYGVVYKGLQRSSGDTVAIKRIPFGDANMEGGVPCAVIREISLLRELDHQNVVKLLDVIQAQPGALYLVFEFVEYDLKTYMDSIQTSNEPMQRRGLPIDKVRSFMEQMLKGVGFCHTYRVLHRDLKPHNLLVTADGNGIKLADFGLARLSALPNGPYTHEVVTLWYRAPELLLGATRYSEGVDIWSIGCIFAEMITGFPLFPGKSDIDQLFKIFQRRGTPTSHTWPAVTRMPHYNPEFPKWPPRHITEFVEMETLGSPNAADLLEKILRYDPDQRVRCKAALAHPYFRETSN